MNQLKKKNIRNKRKRKREFKAPIKPLVEYFQTNWVDYRIVKTKKRGAKKILVNHLRVKKVMAQIQKQNQYISLK